jgi:hypothetical protein
MDLDIRKGRGEVGQTCVGSRNMRDTPPEVDASCPPTRDVTSPEVEASCPRPGASRPRR